MHGVGRYIRTIHFVCAAISAPRVSRSGYPLPSARLVSAVIHWDFDIPHHMHTLMLMQVGQFVDHDMTRTAISKMAVSTRGQLSVIPRRPA